MNIVKKIAVAGTSAALLFSSVGVAFASTDVMLKRTGADSYNRVRVSMSSAHTMMQANYSHVWNLVELDSDTGKNESNKNTGDGEVDTGKVVATVAVSNTGGINTADVDPCGCEEDEDVDVLLRKTGADSVNKVKVRKTRTTLFSQSNMTKFSNMVGLHSDTGDNEANKNTGSGDVKTGNVDAWVEIVNGGNTNDL